MIVGLGIAITVAFTIASAAVDAEHIKKKQYIEDHKSRWWLRFFFFLGIGVFNVFWIIGSALIFTALFDQLLNKERGLPFWYLGTEAKWDRFFSKRKALYVIVKVVSLIGGILFFII